jgi:hypothetical protein
MSQISRFFGIIISMYHDEHFPPHFHADYNEFSIEISINDLSILCGWLPPRVLGLVMEWALIHRKELNDNWKRVEKFEKLSKIDPLD